MRLRNIHENRNKIRAAATSLSELIDFIQEYGNKEDNAAIIKFLQRPTPKAWQESSWLVNRALQLGSKMEENQELINSMEGWKSLLHLTPAIMSSAVYDIDRTAVLDTPRQPVALNEPNRNRLKRALGPLGYVTTMAGISELPTHIAKRFIRDTAKNSDKYIRAAKHDLPHTRVVRQF